MDKLIVSLGVDLGREPIESSNKEQDGAIGKKIVRSVSKASAKRPVTVVSKLSRLEMDVLVHKSIRARGPKLLCRVVGAFYRSKAQLPLG